MSASAGGGPCHVARLGLGESPAWGLLEVMVVAADGSDAAFTGPAAEVVGDRMVQVVMAIAAVPLG